MDPLSASTVNILIISLLCTYAMISTRQLIDDSRVILNEVKDLTAG